VGYHTQDIPRLRSATTGHDFLLVGSFLVDVWAYEYTCGRPLYDLSNRGDEALVRRLYGPREKWQEVKRERRHQALRHLLAAGIQVVAAR